jgi:hypothetical protein
MAKAFDTLSHDFVNCVYKFFNLGPNIIRWLNILGNNREACISLDPDRDTPYFKLGRGRPQGDNPSPNTFNFSVQILIFKLELDQEIDTIPRQVPVIIPQQNDRFRNESNHETSRNESLADDNTTFTLFQARSLGRIKQILNDFENISGLACNFDKTCILPTFDPSQEDLQSISHLEFKVVESITLLGVEITNRLNNIDRIYDKIRNKMINIATFWERFRLSLSGRIVVAKTFLISQLNYTACWLPVPDEQLDSMQRIIDSFVIGTFNISRERVCLPVELGGLGMFNLKKFIEAQKCAWVARTHMLCIDNWRYDLKLLSPGNNLSFLRASDVDGDLHPILKNITNAFDNFRSDFSARNGNYKKSYLFENKAFCTGENVPVNASFFGRQFYRTHEIRIRNLRYCDCHDRNGNFKSIQDFANDGLPLTVVLWVRLRTVLNIAKNKFRKIDAFQEQNSMTIEDFLDRTQKGSKKF